MLSGSLGCVRGWKVVPFCMPVCSPTCKSNRIWKNWSSRVKSIIYEIRNEICAEIGYIGTSWEMKLEVEIRGNFVGVETVLSSTSQLGTRWLISEFDCGVWGKPGVMLFDLWVCGRRWRAEKSYMCLNNCKIAFQYKSHNSFSFFNYFIIAFHFNIYTYISI